MSCSRYLWHLSLPTYQVTACGNLSWWSVDILVPFFFLSSGASNENAGKHYIVFDDISFDKRNMDS